MRSSQRVRCTDVRWAMGKTIAENLFYTFNFPQIFLQDLFSIIEKEFCMCFIYLTCLLIWPWGRLTIWSSQRRAWKPWAEMNDLKHCQSTTLIGKVISFLHWPNCSTQFGQLFAGIELSKNWGEIDQNKRNIKYEEKKHFNQECQFSRILIKSDNGVESLY